MKLSEARAAMVVLCDATEELDWEIAATEPNAAKVERLIIRILVEVGTISRSISPLRRNPRKEN